MVADAERVAELSSALRVLNSFKREVRQYREAHYHLDALIRP